MNFLPNSKPSIEPVSFQKFCVCAASINAVAMLYTKVADCSP